MKKFNEHHNKEKKLEELFLYRIHFDELNIDFNFIEHSVYLFYSYKNICIFEQNKSNKDFWINNDIWKAIENEFNLNYIEIRNFIQLMIEKHFNVYNYNIRKFYPITDSN